MWNFKGHFWNFTQHFWTHAPQNMHFTVLYFCVWVTISLNYDIIRLSETGPRMPRWQRICYIILPYHGRFLTRQTRLSQYMYPIFPSLWILLRTGISRREHCFTSHAHIKSPLWEERKLATKDMPDIYFILQKRYTWCCVLWYDCFFSHK